MKHEALHFRSVRVEDYKYGGLLDATFTIYKGETVLLAGLFNSGVKTLIQLLSGAADDFEGQIFADGRELCQVTFETMLNCGIAVIGKRSLVFGNISFMENLSLLNGQGRMFAVIAEPEFDKDAQQLITILEIDIKTRFIEDLTPFEMIKFDILKTYLSGAKIIVFADFSMYCKEDELLKIIEAACFLKKHGVTLMIELINESTRIFDCVADRCFVFRNGISAAVLSKNEAGIFDRETLSYLIVGRELTTKTEPFKMEQGVQDMEQGANIRLKNLKTRNIYDTGGGKVVGIYDKYAQIPSTIEEFIKAFNTLYEISIAGKTIKINEAVDFVKNRIAIIPNESVERMVFYNLSPVENICFFAQQLFGRNYIYDWNTANYLFDKLTGRHKIVRPCAELKYRKDCHKLSYNHLFEIMIAKWLAINPKIVIMFSPLYNADIKNTERLRGLQTELVSMGKTILFISRNYDKLQNDCSEILCI